MNIKRLLTLLVLFIPWYGFLCSAEATPKIFKGKLAFESTRFILDEKYKASGVCLLKNGKVRFIAKAANPAWSPDGVLLLSAYDEDIYIFKDDGTIAEKIHALSRCHALQWHPKENKIFYVGEEIEDVKDPKLAYLAKRYNKKIYMYDLDKKESALLFYDKTKKYDILSLFISPDGKHLAFRLMGDLEGAYIIDTDGKNLEFIYKNGAPYGWFPDSKNLCYGANIGEDGNLMTPVGATAGYLFKYNIEAKTKETVGKDPFSFFKKLSKDGKYIYFTTGTGILVAPIEDVAKSELIVGSVVINPKNGNKSQEFESDWFQE